MRGLEARPFVTRLGQWKLLAGSLVIALVLVLVGQWGPGAAMASTPGITAVAPTGGTTAGGGTITITGLGFGSAPPAVTIGGTAATDVTLVSDTTVTATIPPGSAGLADVVVTPVDGSPLVLSSAYEYSAPIATPIFDTIAPAVGPTTGGDPVTISGSNLDRVTDIRFGTTWIPSWQFVNLGAGGSSITVIAPYGTVGAADITLSTSGSIEVTKYGAYQYVLPQIAAISPSSGPSNGGTAVTITGSGFGSSGSVSVTIGGVAATNVVRVDSTRITATTGAGTVGAANVVVTVSGAAGAPGAITITGTGIFTYAASVATPTISAITPNSGPISGGGTVTVTGTNFRASDSSLATITFGGVAGTVQSVSTNGKSMTVVVPAHAAGPVDVQVSTKDGRATLRNGFTYNAGPTISSLSPATGIVQGGTFVTLTGTNFGTSGVPVVTIGGRTAICVARLSDTTITFVTPAGTGTGARDVEVTPATRGGSATLAGGFTYAAASTFPTVSSISPSSGLTSGGTSITITGTGFTSATTPSVLVGGSCATAVTVVNSTTITATTPTGVAGERDVVITTATGTVTAAAAFTYADAPAILALSPAVGPTTGGTVVVINGRGFGSGTPVVTVGGVAAASVELLSSTQIRITTPPGTVGGQAVQVTPVGGSTLNKPSAFTYQVPTISSVSPFAGPTRGGTPVTIWGTGFGESGTPTVTFGGVAATSVVRVSSTQVTAVTPAGTAGYVTVTVTPTTGSSSANRGNAFSYVTDVATPTITSSLPSRGPAEGGITVYVSGEHFIGSNSVPATVRVGGVAATNVVVASGGTSLTFRAPALSPGTYDLVVTTNEGSALLRWAYSVSGPPVIDGCNAVSPREIGTGAGSSVTVQGEGFGTAGTPSVTLGGVPVTVTASTDTSVTFTAPAGALGYPQIVVRPTTGGSPVTITGCLFRSADLWITAPTHTIDFGDPTPTFQSTATGLQGSDQLQSVVHVFTGGGYGPSTVAPTNAGTYTVTPANAVLSPGVLSYYHVHYQSATFRIRGLEATVAAEDATKVYGDDDPEFSSTVTGLSEGHSLTGVSYVFSGRNDTSYGPSTTPPTNVGDYWVTPASALVGGTEANYQFTYLSANYTITQRPITVGAVPTFKVYGNADPALEWQIESGNLAYDDTLYGSLDRDPGENVGEYDILRGTLENDNYAITYDSDVLEITPRPIVLTAANTEKVYGDADPILTVEADDLVSGDYLDGFAAREPGENVGTYEITRGTVTAGPNYTVTGFTNGEFRITPRPVEITLYDKSKTYGSVDPLFDYTVTSGSFIGDDSVSGTAERAAGTGVGEYPISQGSLDAGPNYDLSVVGGTLTINPRPLEVTADNQTKIYGDADPAPLSYEVTSGTLVGEDTLTGELSREEGEQVGDYAITPGSLGAGPNYEVTVVGGSLEITKRPITVTADSASRVYGDDDPALTWQITDGSLAFEDSLTGSLERESGDDVGDYSITQGSLDGESYTITFVAGSLEITPRPITVTADPASKEFGESDPVLTASSDDLVGGDELTGSVTRESGENVGTYAITAGTIGAGPNYSVTSFQTETFEITARAIELTASNQSATYGDALPTNEVTLTSGSLAPGDALGGASFAYSVETPTDAGDYNIIPSAATLSVGSASNYTISYVSGTLTISPLAITVTPNSLNKTYGDLDPTFTFLASPSLIGGDELTGSLARESGESVGSYPITQGTLAASSNYELSVGSASLEITTRPIEVTADDRTKTYGDGDPELTWQITDGALVGDDTLSGSLSRESGENVGTREITRGELANDNYEITFVAGELEITPRTITVTIDSTSKEYGDMDPEFTASADGLIGDDVLTGSPERTGGEDVGIYPIGPGDLSAGGNYSISSFTGGSFEITKRSLEITAENASSTYGSALPEFGYQITSGGLTGSDTLTSATVVATGSPTDAGAYELVVSDAVISGGADNYSITYVPGTLTIDPFPVTVTAQPAIKDYRDPDPELTYVASPDLLGDDLFTGSLSRNEGEDVSTYAITQGTLTAGSNYSIDFVSADLTIRVRTIEVTANPAGKVYGDSDPALTWSITDGSLLPGDELSGELTRAGGEDVNDYAIELGSLDNPNYVVDFVPSTFTITKRPITITVDNNSKQYGDDDPTLTASSDDLAFGDLLTGSPEREEGEAVGTYEITIGSIGTSANYTVEFVETGTFEITPREIVVFADNELITYGDTLPSGTVWVADGGLVGTDSITSATFTFDPATPEAVGSYAIVPSDAVFGSGLASNYSITYESGNLAIEPLSLTVTADAANKVYGETDPVFTYDLSAPLVGDDTLSGVLSREAGEAVGTYRTTIGDLSAGSNYSLSFEDSAFEITARELFVTASNNSKVFGETDPSLTWEITDGILVGDDTLTGSLERASGEDANTYEIGQGTLGNSNYSIAFTAGEFEITRRGVVITVDNNSKVYGDEDPVFTADSADLLGDDTVSGAPARESGENVDTYEIGPGTLSVGPNYELLAVHNGSFDITTRPLEITAGSPSITYGDALPSVDASVTGGSLAGDDTLESATVVFDPATPSQVGTYPTVASDAVIGSGLASNYEISYVPGTLTITPFEVTVTAEANGKEYGDTDPVLTWTASPDLLGEDTFTGSLSRDAGETVGTYPITQGTLTAGDNYDVTFESADFEITVRSLEVTASPGTKVYGQSDPALAWTITEGSLLGDDSLTGALGRDAGEGVDEYDITLGTLDNSNYDITFVSGTFSITARPITVRAVNGSIGYGQAEPELEATSDDLLGDDILTGTPVRAPGDAAGVYTISQGTVSAGPNYTIETFTPGTFTITPREIEVTIDDKDIEYGDADPTFTTQFTGGSLVGSDELTGTPSRAPGTTVGEYEIGQGTLALSDNYELSVVPGTLTITPRVIGITANSVSREYGEADPSPLAYSVTSGELADVGDITGELVREPGEDVGEYNILPGTLDAGDNYSFTVEGGTFTITPRSIEVTADNTSEVYGEDDPEFTWSVTDGSLVGEDTLGGELARDAGTNVGDYDITIGSLADSNYEITFVGAMHEITPRPVTVVGDDVDKVYGASDPVLGATATGLLGDDILGGAPTRELGENVGEYAVLRGTLSVGPNYELVEYTPGTFAIGARPLQVTINDDEKVYGELDPTFTHSVTSGTLVGDDELTGSVERESGENVGTYSITQGTLDAGSNYDLAVVAGTLEITRKDAQVTVGNAYTTWGEPTPEFELTPSGLIPGDSLTGSELLFDGSSTVPTLPGAYEVGVQVTGVDSGPVSNYDFTITTGSWIVEGPYTISIDPPSGLTIGGLPFEIRGSGFGFDAPTVYFDGVAATDVVLLDSGTIVGLTPEHAEGVVTVTVETLAGTVELTDAYTYVLPVPGPSIYSLDPGRGPVDGGTEFTVTGEHLVGTDGEEAVVLIDGVPATDVTVAEDGLSLVAVSPPGTVGPRDVDVYTTDGGVTFIQGFLYYTGPAGDVEGALWLDLDKDGEWDASEPPLVGVTLTLAPEILPASGATPVVAYYTTAVTDADGRYSFPSVPYGDWVLSFEGPGGLTPTGTEATDVVIFPLTVDAPSLTLDVPLVGHSGLIDATVRYSDGAPVPGATVLVRWAGPDGVLGTADDIVITLTADANGSFSLSGLPSGSYFIAGYDADGATFGPIAVTLAPGADLVDALYEIELDGPGPGPDPDPDPEPEPEPEPQNPDPETTTPQSLLAATGLDIGYLAISAILLLLLGAVIVGRAGRRSTLR